MFRSMTPAGPFLSGIALWITSLAQAQSLVGEEKVYPRRTDVARMIARVNVRPSSGLDNCGGLTVYVGREGDGEGRTRSSVPDSGSVARYGYARAQMRTTDRKFDSAPARVGTWGVGRVTALGLPHHLVCAGHPG